MEWIPVKDKMPDKWVQVIVLCNEPFERSKSLVNVGYFNNSKEFGDVWHIRNAQQSAEFFKRESSLFSSSHYDFDIITHWMPLPNQPERLSEKTPKGDATV